MIRRPTIELMGRWIGEAAQGTGKRSLPAGPLEHLSSGRSPAGPSRLQLIVMRLRTKQNLMDVTHRLQQLELTLWDNFEVGTLCLMAILVALDMTRSLQTD